MRAIKLIVVFAAFQCGAALASPAPVDVRAVWKDIPGEFANSAQEGTGFSFIYDAKAFGPETFGEWKRADARSAYGESAQTVLQHESGLTVRQVATSFHNSDATEFKLYLKNTGEQTLPAVSAIHALNVSFSGPIADGSCVVSSGGAFPDLGYPPSSYGIRQKCFLPSDSATIGGLITLGAESGRSSSKDLPFFFIHNESKREGMFVAVGWSGQWEALVSHAPSSRTINVRATVPDLDITLQPGEEIPGPTVLVGFYKGELTDGSNRLRRLIRDSYRPKLGGKQFAPIATYDTWWHIWTDYDERLVQHLADSAATLGQEYFLLDAGWYAGTTKGEAGFSSGLGNWLDIDRSKLPNGIKPVADYVRSKGMKFGLFFEPERVAPGSRLATEHPDWILWTRAGEQWQYGHERTWKRWIKETYGADWNDGTSGLLDYGRPEVQAWVRGMLDQYIREYGVKYIRYDFNIDPLPYWNAKDLAGRRGMSQIRHIQGLYSIIDWIRERHPDTVLEGCSSGGQRIDLETVRRFHTFWISDNTYDPTVVRYHLFGLNYFLPGSYLYVAYTLPQAHQRDFKPDDLGFQSFFGGAFGMSGRIDRWPAPMQQLAAQHVATWKHKLRKYLIEDYYPLTPQPSTLKSWGGWQFHDPQDQSGFIQTFRPTGVESTHRFYISGLDHASIYQFTDVSDGKSFTLEGSKAKLKGIEISQRPMSSRTFTYRKLSEASTTNLVGSSRPHNPPASPGLHGGSGQ